MKKISVVIPCYNEEIGIGDVIEGIPSKRLGQLGYFCEVLVINNNSTDRTAEIAREKGAIVVDEPMQGKGYAMLKGFKSVPQDADIVVMLDGDNTYQSKEMIRLVEPIDSGFCDVVVGTRLGGKMSADSMTYFNRVGNWFFTFLVRVAYSGCVTDVCTGYFAWRKHVIDDLLGCVESNGFSLEMEMVTKMARMGYEMYSVPITYSARHGSSSLRPLKDGSVIFYTWWKNIFWKGDGYQKLPAKRYLEAKNE